MKKRSNASNASFYEMIKHQTSLATASVFSTVLETRVEAYLKFWSLTIPQSPSPLVTVNQARGHSVLKGGGAKKMLQTAKTFVTKLVRYIEWIVDPLRGHQFYLIWYCYGQKRPFFWPKPPFLAMRGSRRPRWLAKVDQMVDHSWTHVGGLT